MNNANRKFLFNLLQQSLLQNSKATSSLCKDIAASPMDRAVEKDLVALRNGLKEMLEACESAMILCADAAQMIANAELTATEIALVAKGFRISAVKSVMQRLGVSLRDAARLVDSSLER